MQKYFFWIEKADGLQDMDMTQLYYLGVVQEEIQEELKQKKRE
jgi:hypothetical protein